MLAKSRWPCVFSTKYLREQIDPRIQKEWTEKYPKGAPFGALRQMWRTEHCARLNPYGSDHCAYREEDCANSMLSTVQRTLGDAKTNPRGLFRAYAISLALERADTKPLARDTIRTDVTQGPGDPGDADRDPEERRRLRRANSRPKGIGELLGALDLRPHKEPTKDGEESTQ